METFKSVIEQVGVAIDAAGVIVLILGILVAAAKAMVVLVLGVIILIRTFLSMALEVELEGRWPWQRGTQPQLRRDT